MALSESALKKLRKDEIINLALDYQSKFDSTPPGIEFGIDSTVYINDSLCSYYKMLWGKCRKLLLNKYIYSFWVTNGTIKLKAVENGRVYAITHRNDLVKLFPDNEILADQV